MAQVADYNIANASGASVRSDLNAVFDAIKTLNSGGNDPSNPEPFMPYVDTADSNNLKIRNAANDAFVTVGSVNSANLGLLPRAGGTMTGQLLADDSAGAGAPAIAFDGDTDTGIFRVGSNTIGFATAGVERVEISDSGLDMSNGLPIRFQDSSGAPFVALKSPASVSNNVTFTLPSADGSNGQMLQTNGSGALSFTTVNGVPIGAVFCIVHTSIPSGYLECNGASIPNGTGTVNGVNANFAALYALIGANLPDLRGEFVRGFDNGRGVDSGRSMLSSQGGQNASHNHSISLSGTTSNKSLTGSVTRIAETMAAVGTASGVFSKRSNVQSPTTPNATDSSPAGGFDMDASHDHTFSASGTSGSQGSEARPRNIAMMYVIKY